MMKSALVILCLTALTVLALGRRGKTTNDSPTAQHGYGVQGGQLIDIKRRPYTVSLMTNIEYAGTGVLVHKKWVLTAGSNMFFPLPPGNFVRIASNHALKGGKLIRLENTIRHPDYIGNWTNDLMLLNLSEPVTISKKVKPISLASKLPKPGANTIVTGYGAANGTFLGQLKEAKVPFIPYETCKSHYRRELMTPLSFCASKPNAGACIYDWGAPLVYRNKLIGIYSNALDVCGSERYPAVYADVTQFRKWITDTINS